MCFNNLSNEKIIESHISLIPTFSTTPTVLVGLFDDVVQIVSITTFDSGHATLVPMASPTRVNPLVGLHRKASSIFGLSIQTATAAGPRG